MSFPLWMALARATPVEGWRFEDAQAVLGERPPAGPEESGAQAPPGDGAPA
jgi:hypothetical protein